jgi:hypothetical protein
MPIVANLAGVDLVVDPPYCTPNRAFAGEPNGSVTPAYAGEILLDFTNNCLWKAFGVVNTNWVALTTPN